MLNYWWVTRPKRKLDSVPEVLAVFADISLNQVWNGQRGTQLAYEDALEEAGLKRVGERRDHAGSGGRTYRAWLASLGLIFTQQSTGNIKLTLAGEAIMAGESPVKILSAQVLKYQFPSTFSISRGVQVSPRFKIRPFRFLLKLMMDDRIQWLTEDEIAKVIAVHAENETDKCYEDVVDRILQYRETGDAGLEDNFFELYAPSRGKNEEKPFGYLKDMANTMVNWIEYTQLAKRDKDDNNHLSILEEKRDEVAKILSENPPFFRNPENEESYQRAYGCDPSHKKDTRNLAQTKTVTAQIIAEQKIRNAYISLSIKRPIVGIDSDLVQAIVEATGIDSSFAESALLRMYPHGSIGAFMASYFEMAFKGTEEAVDFEKATTELFRDVFKYNAIHLGQTGSKSAPDILLISDGSGYQSIIDNKAYSKYSITGDHHNRMVHNYIEKIGTYSECPYPIGYFAYIAGGFTKTINAQLQKEADEAGVNGGAVTVSTFIKMIEQQNAGEKNWTHDDLRDLFTQNREIMLSDIS